MPPMRFELTIPAAERPQTYALERAATETGYKLYIPRYFSAKKNFLDYRFLHSSTLCTSRFTTQIYEAEVCIRTTNKVCPRYGTRKFSRRIRQYRHANAATVFHSLFEEAQGFRILWPNKIWLFIFQRRYDIPYALIAGRKCSNSDV